ncbi:hypothetical protein [Arthrobacter mobilis]|uniref:Acetyltransferase (GNAT) family protein n=1 Tax=Arthrobacter mobilis TaxID=2724944 RepID=A0A7X6K6K3_9MICC|nr:hypothetical protein [Arthrobacter mobilis]NKX55475.1 hypothetical protein [Arthrobacter mobilis]
MIEVEPEYLYLSYRMTYRRKPDAVNFPEDYPMTWEVDVSADVFEDDDSDGQEMEIGRAVVHVIPAAGDIDLLETLDAVDQEAAGFAEVLELHPQVLEESGLGFFGGDLMILSTLEIKPGFRGQKLGHAVLESIHATVGRNCPLIILRASPLPGSGREEPPAGSPAKTALQGYWEEYGFALLDGDYMVYYGHPEDGPGDLDHEDEDPGRERELVILAEAAQHGYWAEQGMDQADGGGDPGPGLAARSEGYSQAEVEAAAAIAATSPVGAADPGWTLPGARARAREAGMTVTEWTTANRLARDFLETVATLDSEGKTAAEIAQVTGVAQPDVEKVLTGLKKT